jgi:hypothetical protein
MVIGSMGSGTTLLRLMLDSHPNIMIAQETGFLRAAQAQYFIPFWKFGGEWLDRIGMTEPELDEAVGRFYDGFFGAAAAKRGASRWGDKTPYHVHHMDLAARIFPDAQFVATVRQPGAVARSMDRFHWDWTKGIQHWSHSNQAMVDSAVGLGQRFHLIRYEDLVTDTEQVMREVLGFLDEPWDDRVLHHHTIQDGRAEGGTRASDPIDTARMARWLAEVSPAQVDQLVQSTKAQARLFGYDPAQGEPVARLNRQDRSALGITGDQLKAQFDECQPIPRRSVNPMFENRLYTPASMAEELRKAYTAGISGGRVRPAYRPLVEAELPRRRRPRGRMVRLRRRVSRAVSPDL